MQENNKININPFSELSTDVNLTKTLKAIQKKI